MAYYTALISAWTAASAATGAVLPSGVTGGLLTGLTTAQKIAAVNAWTLTGSVPTSFNTTGPALLNCINYAEFKALTAAQQANLLALCNSPGAVLGGSGNVAQIAPGMFLDYFTNHSGATILALTALAQAATQAWDTVSVASGGAGLNGPVNANDCTTAGLS